MANSQTITIKVPVSKRLYEEANELVGRGFFQSVSELTRIGLAEKVLILLGGARRGLSYKERLESLRTDFCGSSLFKGKSLSTIINDLRRSRGTLWKEKYARFYPNIRQR